jgi:hypothetical protein
MEGRITIELRTDHTPDSGSGLPDLGHDAYSLMKAISALTFKDANGKAHPIGDCARTVTRQSRRKCSRPPNRSSSP